MNPIQWRLKTLLHRAGLWTRAEQLRAKMRFRLRSPHEGDFRLFSRLPKTAGLFVDIGANAGQSALSFAMFNETYEIVSFEPNAAMKEPLTFAQGLLGRRYRFFLKGIGSQPARQKLYIPEVKGLPFTQEATFKRDLLVDDPVTRDRIKSSAFTDRYDIKEYDFELARLDDLSLRPDVIKMDTQGFELEGLKGMERTLQECAPLLMLENGHGLNEIRDFLRTKGYEAFGYSDSKNMLVPLAGEPLNVFFLHESRLQEYRKLDLLNS